MLLELSDAGALYVIGHPLAVCFDVSLVQPDPALAGTLKLPQSPCWFFGSTEHVRLQSTPSLLESFETTAITFSEKLTATVGAGCGENATVI
jgi:hypothetical protein